MQKTRKIYLKYFLDIIAVIKMQKIKKRKENDFLVI